ncbi:MAG TPA: response regulator transcription factor [Steroidobacteraceae bacterium]|nr:response regulator transcription factor [Steroidobacteraceae bacterium]
MRVLIVEDDETIASTMSRGLTLLGYVVDHVPSAEAASAALLSEQFDLAIVDLGLPQEDGTSLVRRIRRTNKTLPVVVVTARDSIADRVDTLDMGADDYLVKPVALAELLARCRAHIRRARAVASSKVQIGALAVDLEGRRAMVAGEALDLTRREWLLLEYLAVNAGRIVSKERLLDAISSAPQDLSLNSVEAVVSRLRAKLGEAARIRTIRGLGYRLDDEP